MSKSPAVSDCAEALEDLCNIITPPTDFTTEALEEIHRGNGDGKDVVSESYNCCTPYPNAEVKRKIQEINDFYDVTEDKREYSEDGNLNEESKNFWLWQRF